jgi:hypothetical protein
MNNRQRLVTFSMATLLCAAAGVAQAPQPGQPAASSVWAAPPAPGGQQATSPSACGNQPMCYDAQDFAVAVVDFRMSVSNGFKIMDATLRFVNKTNQPLILGYLDGSAVALDDQGNRYAPYGNRGLAGIGVVSGNSGDAKFVLQPAGAGDARWELLWRPGPQDPVGSTFALDMTIRELNTLTGGAHTLGAEVPLRFQSLANGMTGAAGAAAIAGAPATTGVVGVAGASSMMATGGTGLAPCGPAGTMGAVNTVAGTASSVGGQQAAGAASTATNTANGAAAALSNLKSIFGKKNNAAPATNAAGAAPCVPAASSAAMPVAAGTSTAPVAAGQIVSAPAAAATPAKVTAATAAKTTTPAAATTAAKPASLTAAKPAVAATTAPATKPVAKPATQPVAKKPAPASAPATTSTPPSKPATNQ